jgi:flagellar protein FlgJ
MGLDPSKAYNIEPNGKVTPIGEGGVTVNNNMGEDKFGAEFAKLDAQMLNTVSTSGLAAQRNLGRIDQLESLLQQSPSGLAGAAALAAGEWGIPTEGLDTLQAAQAVINTLIPEQRQPGSGPMSDRDIDLFKQGLPRVINQPNGNQIILGAMRGIAQYDAEGAAIVQQLRDGQITRAQAFERLQGRKNPLEAFRVPPKEANSSENPLPPQEGKRLKYNPATGVLE